MNFLYRLSSGEILAHSTEQNPWPDIDSRFFGILSNPTVAADIDLSRPMIWDGSQVRNATQAEVAGFQAAAQNDDNLLQRELVAELFNSDRSTWGKMLRLITLVTLDEVNTLRQQLGLPLLTVDDIRNKARAYLDAGAVD